MSQSQDSIWQIALTLQRYGIISRLCEYIRSLLASRVTPQVSSPPAVARPDFVRVVGLAAWAANPTTRTKGLAKRHRR